MPLPPSARCASEGRRERAPQRGPRVAQLVVAQLQVLEARHEAQGARERARASGPTSLTGQPQPREAWAELQGSRQRSGCSSGEGGGRVSG